MPVNAVFQMFKHKEWRPEIVHELRGTNGRLEIVLNDLPCLRDPLNDARKFAFAEFGAELLESLCAEQFADLDHVRRVVSTGQKTVYVRLRDLPPVVVHVAGQISQDPDQFCLDLADCLVVAFWTEHILLH